MTPPVDLAWESLPWLDVALLAIASLPIWLGMLLLVSGGILLTLIGSLFVGAAQEPIVDVLGTIEANFLSGAKFGFLGEVFAALLAFVLVDGGIRYTMARQQVQVEASAIRLFDSVVADLSDPAVTDLRHQLRTYASAVVESEFITMQVGRESLAAREGFERVLDGYLRLENHSEQDRFLRLQADQFLTKILDSRQHRLQAARPGLRTLIWTILLGNALIAVMFSWFFRARSLAAHTAMAVVMTAALMVVVHLAILLYHPFTGELAVSSTPYLTLPRL